MLKKKKKKPGLAPAQRGPVFICATLKFSVYPLGELSGTAVAKWRAGGQEPRNVKLDLLKRKRFMRSLLGELLVFCVLEFLTSIRFGITITALIILMRRALAYEAPLDG